ncbi:MAG: HEPN domain-containing protein [Anaerolineae bacterium]|nr:HEPN domain-containing protein [Anaerolineae bacterium]
MPTIDPDIFQEWFYYGDMDRQAAAMLMRSEGPAPVIAFHVQQAVEKYLKGYLLAQGWQLRRIHDLTVLLHEATTHDPQFASFLPDCQRITEYYIESRYPLGIESHLDKSILQQDLKL